VEADQTLCLVQGGSLDAEDAVGQMGIDTLAGARVKSRMAAACLEKASHAFEDLPPSGPGSLQFFFEGASFELLTVDGTRLAGATDGGVAPRADQTVEVNRRDAGHSQQDGMRT